MTKRLKSKHKVDRRLKANIWGRPKSPFNSRAYPLVSTVKTKKANQQITEYSYKQSKNSKHIMEILMNANLETLTEKHYLKREIQQKT